MQNLGAGTDLCFLLLLYLLPEGEAFLRGGNLYVAEDVRVSAYHLFRHALDDIIDSEAAFLRRDLSMHDDLQQHIAKLLAQIVIILIVYRSYHLAGFLYKAFFQAFVSLTDVPRASVRSPEVCDYLDKIFKIIFPADIAGI